MDSLSNFNFSTKDSTKDSTVQQKRNADYVEWVRKAYNWTACYVTTTESTLTTDAPDKYYIVNCGCSYIIHFERFLNEEV